MKQKIALISLISLLTCTSSFHLNNSDTDINKKISLLE